jgi:capsular polysaccharide transport system permease protein
MTNIISPKLGIDPAHGRRVVDTFTKQAVDRLKSVSSSRPFVAFVIIAALALAIYYFLLAAPIYVSEASLQLRGREQPNAAAAGLLSAFGGNGATAGVTSTDVAAFMQYVGSYEMAAKLDQRFHLREVYSQPRLDFLNWMSRGASKEDYLDFYRKMVKVKIDRDTQLLTVDVRAFDPVLAQKMCQAIVAISADYVNSLSASVHRDTVRASETELQKAEDAARTARLAVTAYRARTGMIDPLTSAATQSAGIAGMQQQIVETRAEMTQLLSYNTPNSPQVRELQARIAGLQQQIEAEKKRISDTQADDSIAQRLREFEGLMITSDYADRQLVAALTAYDSAKQLAGQRERFVVQVIPPDLPQTATEPHRFLSFIEALLVLVAVYGIVALAIAGVRDHQGI